MVNVAGSHAEQRKVQAEIQAKKNAQAQQAAAQAEKPNSIYAEQQKTVVNTAKTNGTPAEVEVPGNGTGFNVTVMGDCKECEFNHIETENYTVINGNNNNVTNGANSPILDMPGNNSAGAVTYGNDSNINQATGKNSQIHQATIKYLDSLKISKETQERLEAQDQNIQSRIKDNMTSLKSTATLESAKNFKSMDEEVTQLAEKQRFPITLDDLLAENSKFRDLPKETQKAFLESGLPASAISDFIDATFTDYVKFDKENKVLTIADYETGIMLKLDTSEEKYTNNLQFGRVLVPTKDSDGATKVSEKLLIDGAKVQAQFGFDPIKEFNANTRIHYAGDMPTEIVFGERSKIQGITIARDNYQDKVTFARTKASNYLKDERSSDIKSTFSINYINNAKPKTTYFFGTPRHHEYVKNGEQITYYNSGNAYNRLTVGNEKVTTSESLM